MNRREKSPPCFSLNYEQSLMYRLERMPVEFKRLVTMRHQVGNAVSARVQMKFVRDFECVQRAVQFIGALIESEGILQAAIKINLHLCELRRIQFCQHKRAIGVPELPVDRLTKHVGQ